MNITLLEVDHADNKSESGLVYEKGLRTQRINNREERARNQEENQEKIRVSWSERKNCSLLEKFCQEIRTLLCDSFYIDFSCPHSPFFVVDKSIIIICFTAS
jgi:hypothetical protein